ncbi:hypothetical protein MLD38_012571 [Melastoma candidum]|uniref:Uncharacterized protein n=1 Tax=Melastoma candidum TaxID=119954 RepID=A0ACB9R8J3_9MYRT|nr:hypothetical protein MLD38_012571 [Melastoma candidum]
MESSAFVIKVNYGGTLRRFSARVDNGELDLDMNGLKAKILSLFEIPSDVNLTITYVDEDGDVVTLVEDEELRGVMQQNLKFLRINVVLNNEKRGRLSAASSVSSTRLRPPRVRQPLPNVKAVIAEAVRSVPDLVPSANAAVTEAMRSVPKSLQESLLKLSTDFVSKAASSSPALSDLANIFAEMAKSYAMAMQPPSDGETASQQGVSVGSTDLKQEASEDSRVDILGDALSKLALGDSCCKKVKEVDVADDPAASGASIKIPINLNASTSGKLSLDKESYKDQILKDSNVQVNETEQLRQPTELRGGNNTSQKAAAKAPVVDSSASAVSDYGVSGKSSLDCSAPAPGMPMASPPFGAGDLSEGIFRGVPYHNNSYVHSRAVFHKGIRCDGCGLYPITGPRFKSKVKENFDLCNFCFAATMAKLEDYIRLDRPVPCGTFLPGRPPVMGLNDQDLWQAPPTLPQVFKGVRAKASKPKLDSHFVSDVTVMDGTLMAPSTPFTKIWRMRNTGGFAWHRGIQLVWIGGDKFCDTTALELEIPAAGVAMDGELDIAMNFKSPNLPGRYISYWRMASPSGQKFGQRVGVLIQVDASLGDSGRPVLEDLNLNLPPEMPMDDFFGDGNGRLNIVDSMDSTGVQEEIQIQAASTPETDDCKRKEAEMNFPISSTLHTVEDGSRPAAESSSSITYPKMKDAPLPVASPATVPGVPVAVPVASAPAEFTAENLGTGIEAAFLKVLEEMGFKQVDMNKEILSKNAYDLEKSIEALCEESKWDGMLLELQEMGFGDMDKNKMLLEKNDGSIKQVVMDLLTGESLI